VGSPEISRVLYDRESFLQTALLNVGKIGTSDRE
jgi:hypothetical protein